MRYFLINIRKEEGEGGERRRRGTVPVREVSIDRDHISESIRSFLTPVKYVSTLLNIPDPARIMQISM